MKLISKEFNVHTGQEHFEHDSDNDGHQSLMLAVEQALAQDLYKVHQFLFDNHQYSKQHLNPQFHSRPVLPPLSF